MYKRLSTFATIIMLLALIVTGCTSQASNIGLARENDRDSIGTDFVVAEVGSYDSADTAVVISVEPDTGSVTFMNIESGKQYTLSYDGTTYVKDKYEGPMSMSQVKAGDIVDITFLKSKKKLASVQISPRSWTFENIENYDLGGQNKTAVIGSNTYSLPDQVVVISEGLRREVMDIVNKDVLTVSGIDHEIYSIEVAKGHGYLRLSNDQALVGGWIEVGNTVIQKITENMLLAVPEGSYQVLLSNGGASCVKDVVIERNKEVILDVGGLEILQDKTGKILISVNPSTASVSIDGEMVDISEEVELSYGIHKVRLEAEGYQTMTKYIQVGSEYASISFTMEEGNQNEDDDGSVSSNNSYDDIIGAVTGNRVYIDAPLNVEVYLDGNYVGVSPVSFTKVTGDHTITLSKNGYESRSYTIYLYDDGEDITYSFTDLEPLDGATSSSRRTTSGKTTSTSQRTTSSASTNNTVSGNNIVSIKAPENAEITMDGEIYIGICPTYFSKVMLGTGRHTITLSQQGYKSANYIIYLYDDGRDIEYRFKPLEPEETEGSDKPPAGNEGTEPPGGDDKPSTGDEGTEPPGGDDKPSTGDEGTEKPGGDNKPSTGDEGTEKPGGDDKPSTGDEGTEKPEGGDKPSTGDEGTEKPEGGDKPSTGDEGTEKPGGNDKPPTEDGKTETSGGDNTPATNAGSSNSGNNNTSTVNGNQQKSSSTGTTISKKSI